MTAGARRLGVMDAPSRSSPVGAALIALAVAVFSVALMMPGVVSKWMGLALLLLFLTGWMLRLVYAVHATLIASLLVAPASILPIVMSWPLAILSPLTVYAAVVLLSPPLRRSVGWLHGGAIDVGVLGLMLATIVVSAASLVGWVAWTKPDIAHHLALIPELPAWAYPFAGIGFAIFNAAMEEAVFRGVIMEALDSAFGAGYRSVFLQAVPFAALHYLAGFPSGWLGFVMVLLYGVMLGVIRRLSRGMLGPLITHAGADMSIFAILAFVHLHRNGGGIL